MDETSVFFGIGSVGSNTGSQPIQSLYFVWVGYRLILTKSLSMKSCSRESNLCLYCERSK